MSESPKTDLERLTRASERGDTDNRKLAEAAGALGNDVERAKDNRGEERFLWAIACLILFDCFAFSQMESWSGPIVIGVVQLVFVIALAKHLRVEEIAKLLTRFMDRVGDYPDRKS
jgi:hypothetical protein